MLKEKTSAQINAERAWRGALIQFIEHKSDFNVNFVADKLTSVEFNKSGEMIERGKGYAYLTRHTPSLMGIWRIKYQEELSGKSETKIHTRHTKRMGVKTSGVTRRNRPDSKSKDSKPAQKNTRPKHGATVHPG